MSPLERDFVGHGRTVPKVQWPRNARVALTFVINYEAGGERSVAFGDSWYE